MKKLAIILFLGGFIAACGGGAGSDVEPTGPDNSVKTADNGNPSYDPERGEGKFTKVEVGEKLDVPMAEAGEKVYGVKCSSWPGLERSNKPSYSGVDTQLFY